ncbi:MAG: hypothetical protein IJR86_04670 [Bacteroidaceae bacterium]|nr:hypothetical protein [Bacteroidaceae bacterium]
MKLYELIKSLEPIDSKEKVDNILNFLKAKSIVFSPRRKELILLFIHDNKTQDYFLTTYGDLFVEEEKPIRPTFNKKKLKSIQKMKKERDKKKVGGGEVKVFPLSIYYIYYQKMQESYLYHLVG